MPENDEFVKSDRYPRRGPLLMRAMEDGDTLIIMNFRADRALCTYPRC